jgi:uncharacterized DUF497 family protein
MDIGYPLCVDLAVEFMFDQEKNARLGSARGVSFEDVIEAMTAGAILGVIENPNQDAYPNQIIIVVRIRDYPFCVPTDVRGNVYHLRTVYPCRKFKHLLEGGFYGK